jgi:Raf kinase inhibitor-like YbhB/YbcL family protein
MLIGIGSIDSHNPIVRAIEARTFLPKCPSTLGRASSWQALVLIASVISASACADDGGFAPCAATVGSCSSTTAATTTAVSTTATTATTVVPTIEPNPTSVTSIESSSSAEPTSSVEPAESSGAETSLGELTLSSPVLVSSPECSMSLPDSCPVFPVENTSYMGNANISPELTWHNVPPGTASFAIKFTDVTFGQIHWAIWNIPATLQGLPAGVPIDSPMPATPQGASQTNATFADGDGYLGPQAPCNVYEFVLYALSLETFAPEKPEYVTLVGDELENLGDAILGRATLSGRNFVVGECE